jgi:excisionase family DNA binding protein
MPTYYTLEEAARVLGMSAEELRHEAQLGKIHFYRDGATMRFRADLIDEEARRRGMGSDPSLPLSDLELGAADPLGTGTDLDLSEFQLDVVEDQPRGSKTGTRSDADILIDEVGIAPEGSSSSTIIGMKGSGKKPTDSDIKLVPEQPLKTASDSDVRLAQPAVRKPSDSDVTLVSDEAVDFDSGEDFPLADPNATMLQKSPLAGSSEEIEVAAAKVESDSDFELSPSSVIDALQPESGSDFELTALDVSSDEQPAAEGVRRPSDSDVTAADPSAAGINLNKPSDSGINLASGPGLIDSIELAPLDEGPGMGAQAAPLEQPADPAATALPIRTGGEKDLFEDTDFEVDALDAGSDDQTMQIEAASDFELDESESASEVFALDEEAIDENAATAMRPAALAAGGVQAEESSSGETDAAWADLENEAVSSASGTPVAVAAPARGGMISPALARAGEPEWGTPWVIMLGLASLCVLFLAFVGMDLVHNLYEFRGNGPASGLIKAIAGLMPE